MVTSEAQSENVTNNSATNPAVGGLYDEVDKSGFMIQGKLLGSYYWDSVVLDFGGGWHMSEMTYTNFDGDPVETGSSGGNGDQDLTMTHSHLFLALSPRYRLTNELQLGPLLQYHLGTNVQHGEVTGEEDSLFYVGADLKYDIPIGESTLLRLGANVMMDITEEDRMVLLANALVEVGFHLFGGIDEPIEEEEFVEEEPEFPLEEELEPLPEPPPPPSFSDERPSVVETSDFCVVRFPTGVFHFDTSMSHLKYRKTRNYLRELGSWLNYNPDVWKFVTAAGHTDIRGGDRVNGPLSRGRARTFYTHLKEGGSPVQKMAFEGRSFHEPADPDANNQSDPVAWKRNRRTELEFEDSDCAAIMDKVTELNDKFGYR